MARHHLTGSLLCATALLAACGGGSGGNVASAPPPTVVVAPPATAPTPTPTPAATTFVPSAVVMTSGQPPVLSREKVKFDYDADFGVYLYTGVLDGVAVNTYRFGPGDESTELSAGSEPTYLDPEPGNFRIFGDEDTPTLFVLTNSSRNSRIVLSHLSYGLLGFSDSFVFGTETPAGNMPRTGSAAYHGVVDGFVAGRRLLGSTGSLSVNFATGTVSTSMALRGFGGTEEGTPGGIDLNGTLAGSGTIGAGTSHFSGSLTGTIDCSPCGPTGTPGGPSATGSFLGGFYGPNAAEAGYVFTASTGSPSNSVTTVTGITVTGAFVGKQ